MHGRALVFCLCGLLPALGRCLQSETAGPAAAAKSKDRDAATDARRQVVFKVQGFT